MKIIGLTAGTGCGASTVAKILEKKGFAVIEADKIARNIMRPNSVTWRKIVRIFGESVLNGNLEIDRANLGLAAFANRESLEKLNKITHPPILKEIRKQIKKIESKNAGAVILDAPLLIETRLLGTVDFLVVVKADFETRVKRIMARHLFSREEAIKRINAQIPLEKKLKLADFTIDNSGALSETRKQVEKLSRKIKAMAERK